MKKFNYKTMIDFKNVKISQALMLVCTLFASCKKYVEVDPPVNKIEASQVFANENVATSAVNGLYGYNFVSSSYHDTYKWLYTGFSADEVFYYTASANIDQFTSNDLLENNTISWSMWTTPYKAIYQSNLIIQGLQHSTEVSVKTKKEGVAVAKFFRALNYLNLVSLFGDVPLVLETSVYVNQSIPRTPSSQIFAQIISDLLDAKVGLSGSNNGNVHINEKSTTALLARTYLYNKQWQKAAEAAGELINGSLKGGLVLENLTNVFLRSSRETIFAISSNASSVTYVNYTYAGAILIPANSAVARSTYQLTPSFLAAFEPGDARRANWVGRHVGSTASPTYYPYKYKQRVTPTDGSKAEDQVLIRLAEMYLIRAEALAHLGNISSAIADINAIRTRAGLGNLPATLSRDNVLLAVEKERRVELFAEYGHRWTDLVRTGRADAVLGALKPNTWKSTDVLYPIYLKELEYNKSLKQNPGYTF